MAKKTDETQAARQHDENIFREGDTILSERDLLDLINVIYSDDQYRGTQSAKLARMIDYLTLETNSFIKPEFANQSKRLSAFLDSFMEFLQRNFQQDQQTEDGDALYFLSQQGDSFEREAFLTEFQMVSVDVNRALREYRATIINTLKI